MCFNIFIIYVYFEVKSILETLLEKNNQEYANFATLGSWQDNFNQFVPIFDVFSKKILKI